MKIAYTIDQIADVVKTLVLPLLDKYRIITLSGSVGAGKTTLTKELLRQLGFHGLATSPTFAYVNSYKTASGKKIHHFDLYRIESLDSFMTIGFDEYLYDAEWTSLIEWPAVIDALLRDGSLKGEVCHILLAHDEKDPEKRLMTLST